MPVCFVLDFVFYVGEKKNLQKWVFGVDLQESTLKVRWAHVTERKSSFWQCQAAYTSWFTDGKDKKRQFKKWNVKSPEQAKMILRQAEDQKNQQLETKMFQSWMETDPRNNGPTVNDPILILLHGNTGCPCPVWKRIGQQWGVKKNTVRNCRNGQGRSSKKVPSRQQCPGVFDTG